MLLKRTFHTGQNASSVNLGLLLLRLSVGVVMLSHGLPKLSTLVAGHVQFADPFGIGPTASLALVVFAELVCSFLLILGMATRLAAIVLIINMLVAVFYAHAADPFGKKELAVLYLIFYIGFLITGPGAYSIDSMIKNKSER